MKRLALAFCAVAATLPDAASASSVSVAIEPPFAGPWDVLSKARPVRVEVSYTGRNVPPVPWTIPLSAGVR